MKAHGTKLLTCSLETSDRTLHFLMARQTIQTKKDVDYRSKT